VPSRLFFQLQIRGQRSEVPATCCEKKSRDLLGPARIALVRHGGGTHLVCAEGFFHFANLGPLERADLNPDLVERGRDTCTEHEILCIPVAGDHLAEDIYR